MPNKNVRYLPDERGMDALVNSKAIGDIVVKAGEQGLALAVATAPRRTSAFAQGFEVVAETVPGGRLNKPRAGAIIRNDLTYAPFVRKSKGAKQFISTIPAFVNSVGKG